MISYEVQNIGKEYQKKEEKNPDLQAVEGCSGMYFRQKIPKGRGWHFFKWTYWHC